MDFNIIYPKSQINKIFPDICLDNFGNSTEVNIIPDDRIINDNLETFDKIFNCKRSRNSSFDENDFTKLCFSKSNPLTTNSGIKFNHKKDINNINVNNNINIEGNNKNINNFNKIIEVNKNNNEENKKEKLKKKILFSSFQPNNMKELQTQKQKQKMKNKLSARKSRLKKKLYVEQLEKEYILIKKELNDIKQKMGNSNQNNIISLNEDDCYFVNNNNYNKKCEQCVNIDGLKSEENFIISEKNNNRNNINIISSFAAKQRILLEQLLIKQIHIMMPIKVKMFQNKFLKLSNINENDDINAIKNKIEENLQAIQELYDIESFKNEDNGATKFTKYQFNGTKSKSMSYQIYSFYNNLKNYINEFEKIYFSLI